MDIRLHKELNRMPIKFEREIGIRFFKEVAYKFNKKHSLDEYVYMSNQELRELLNLKDTLDLKKFQKDFHDNDKGIFNAVMETPDGRSISGGLLLTEVDRDQTYIKVIINPLWKDFFYSKLDIDQWHSIKGKTKEIKALQLEKPQEEKLLNMMTSVINHSIKGKYSQRLLDLLMQFKGSGEFKMSWIKFREVLEIPSKYNGYDIDRRILNPAKVELLKAGIKITKIEKKKKGRSIDSIRILFKLEKSSKFKQSQGTESSKGDPKELRKSMTAPEISELRLYKNKVNGLVHKQLPPSQRQDFITKVEAAKTLEEVNDLVLRYDIKNV